MTDLLERAIEAVRGMTPAAQDDVARILLRLAERGEGGVIALSAEERSAVEASKAQAARSEFASEAETRAVWAKHGL